VPTNVPRDGFGFSRNEGQPAQTGFLSRESEEDREERRRRALEDAWASLEEKPDGGKGKGGGKKTGDEYAAALSISPSMIGLISTNGAMDNVMLPSSAVDSKKDGDNLAAGLPIKPASNPFSVGLWGGGSGSAVGTTSGGSSLALSGWEGYTPPSVAGERKAADDAVARGAAAAAAAETNEGGSGSRRRIAPPGSLGGLWGGGGAGGTGASDVFSEGAYGTFGESDAAS